MPYTSSHIRKAAVLIRSLDADTATTLLTQLSQEEAAAIRAAIRSLGPIEPEEQADVAAEFRRVGAMAAEAGVELQLSASAASDDGGARRFEFLEHTPIDAVTTCLAREHVQTIAVVLSHLRPARAAEVLAGLPPRLQADALERLSALGPSDPDSVNVVEHELAAWLERQSAPSHPARRTDAVAAILDAAQQSARHSILGNLRQYNGRLAEQVAQLLPHVEPAPEKREAVRAERQEDRQAEKREEHNREPAVRHCEPPRPVVAAPSLTFNDLSRLARDELSAVLCEMDANVLVLALAASSDELVDQVTGQMPRKVAKAFRRQLRRLGPTRLRDVEAAQAAVAAVATRVVQARLRRQRVAA